MSAKNKWLLGVQWGALAALAQVLWEAWGEFRVTRWADVTDWPRLWWCGFNWVALPGWIVALYLLLAGSRWARAAFALMILGHVTVAWISQNALGVESLVALCMPLLLPVLPLAVLRVEKPRVVLALAALGRFRDAWARSGGLVAFLVALVVLSTRHAAFQAAPLGTPAPCHLRCMLDIAGSLTTLWVWDLTGILLVVAALATWVTSKLSARHAPLRA